MQAFLARGQRRAAILVPEKGRVGETGKNDALVTVADLVRVLAVEVGHEYELRQQLAVLVGNGEVALMARQRRYDALARQAQERVVEATRHRYRPLDERRNLIIEGVAIDDDATGRLGLGLDAFPDEVATACEVGDDMAPFFQGTEIIGRRLDSDGRARVKAMPVRFIAGGNTHDARIEDLASMEQHDPVHRPHEFGLTGAPTHAPRNRQGRERPLDELRHKFARGLAFLHHIAGQPLALRGFCPAEVVGVDAAFFCESGCRGGHVAVLVEGNRYRRAFLRLLAIFLAVGQRFDHDGEPPRARVNMHVATCETRFVDSGLEVGAKRFHQAAQGLRRQLFSANLDEEVFGFAHDSSSPATDSTIGKPSASRDA